VLVRIQIVMKRCIKRRPAKAVYTFQKRPKNTPGNGLSLT